jgi:hypothetical protein
MTVFALGVVPHFEYHGTQNATAPTDCTELFRIVALLVYQVSLVKDLLRFFEANAVFSLYLTAFLADEVEARI